MNFKFETIFNVVVAPPNVLCAVRGCDNLGCREPVVTVGALNTGRGSGAFALASWPPSSTTQQRRRATTLWRMCWLSTRIGLHKYEQAHPEGPRVNVLLFEPQPKQAVQHSKFTAESMLGMQNSCLFSFQVNDKRAWLRRSSRGMGARISTLTYIAYRNHGICGLGRAPAERQGHPGLDPNTEDPEEAEPMNQEALHIDTEVWRGWRASFARPLENRVAQRRRVLASWFEKMNFEI